MISFSFSKRVGSCVVGGSVVGGSVAGGGRYDKMIGKFTGQDTPACGFSIGFERIILLLMESGFKIPESPKKVAYLVEKNYPADKLVAVMQQAKEAREKRAKYFKKQR